jgi:hypothetical protein
MTLTLETDRLASVASVSTQAMQLIITLLNETAFGWTRWAPISGGSVAKATLPDGTPIVDALVYAENPSGRLCFFRTQVHLDGTLNETRQLSPKDPSPASEDFAQSQPAVARALETLFAAMQADREAGLAQLVPHDNTPYRLGNWPSNGPRMAG